MKGKRALTERIAKFVFNYMRCTCHKILRKRNEWRQGRQRDLINGRARATHGAVRAHGKRLTYEGVVREDVFIVATGP